MLAFWGGALAIEKNTRPCKIFGLPEPKKVHEQLFGKSF
jgi:hypothetical protein